MSVDVASWIGRSVTAHDVASARMVAGLAALLDHVEPPWRAGVVPPLGHWLYFPPDAPQGEIGVDGHARQGIGLIPDTGLPRRMWAGSRIRFCHDIPVGAHIARTSELIAAKQRSGRSGKLIMVTLRHEIVADNRIAVIEEQDIAYRAPPGPDARQPTGEMAPAMTQTRQMVADTVRMFRFSALTFNAHRIHYDRDYAMHEEGYPDLVVQGPYVAMLLMDHFLRERPGARPTLFSFRGVSPVFAGEALTLGLSAWEGGIDLTAAGMDGRLTMKAAVQL